MFALDTKFLAEKLDSGIFWRVHNSLPSNKEEDRLHRYWGIAFEAYLNWLLTNACKDSRNSFYPSPRYEKTGEQVCDAIVLCGVDAVFLEYKGSTFTAASKYDGDLGVLRSEIEEKLIGTESKRKGAHQLARAVLSVFDRTVPASVSGIDLSRVGRVYPALITRDELGGCFGISHYLNMRAETFFNRQNVKPVVVTPIFCLSSDGLEGLSAYLHDETFSHLLRGWYKADPELHWSFQTVDNHVINSLGFKENRDLENAYTTIFENARRILFPDSDPNEIE